MNIELQFQEKIVKVLNDLRSNKNLETIEYIDELFDMEPTIDQAWLILGVAKRRIGGLDYAIRSFQKTVEFNNFMIEGWGLFTIMYLNKSEILLSENSLERAVELNPNNEKFLYYQNNLIHLSEQFGPFF